LTEVTVMSATPEDRSTQPSAAPGSFAGAHQPARRSFDIDHVLIGGRDRGVRQADVIRKPFCVLTRLEKEAADAGPRMLVVPPLSGHSPFLLRDLVLTLLPDNDIHVADWVNARHVPSAAGAFGFEDNVLYVMDMMRALGPGAAMLALCQGVVPALAATALLAQANDPATPRSLILVAGPVDSLANPTRVVRLLRRALSTGTRPAPSRTLRRATRAPVAASIPGRFSSQA